MRRTTLKDLEGIVRRINIMTKSPLEPYTKDKHGNFKANIGAYLLDGAYGGWALRRIANEAGGEHDILACGYQSKAELARLMFAYIRGLEACDEVRS